MECELEKLSSEHKNFMIMMENGAKFVNVHYELYLSFRNPALKMSNNIAMVGIRAKVLKKKI